MWATVGSWGGEGDDDAHTHTHTHAHTHLGLSRGRQHVCLYWAFCATPLGNPWAGPDQELAEEHTKSLASSSPVGLWVLEVAGWVWPPPSSRILLTPGDAQLARVLSQSLMRVIKVALGGCGGEEGAVLQSDPLVGTHGGITQLADRVKCRA